jgi:hypothetical protein
MKNYQQAKQKLKEIAKIAKKEKPTDKPYIRQSINDSSYFIGKDLQLTEYQKDLLSNYACKLHPKK